MLVAFAFGGCDERSYGLDNMLADCILVIVLGPNLQVCCRGGNVPL